MYYTRPNLVPRVLSYPLRRAGRRVIELAVIKKLENLLRLYVPPATFPDVFFLLSKFWGF